MKRLIDSELLVWEDAKFHAFLGSHPNAPVGVRFSTQNYSEYDNIKSIPLYAVAALRTLFAVKS